MLGTTSASALALTRSLELLVRRVHAQEGRVAAVRFVNTLCIADIMRCKKKANQRAADSILPSEAALASGHDDDARGVRESTMSALTAPLVRLLGQLGASPPRSRSRTPPPTRRKRQLDASGAAEAPSAWTYDRASRRTRRLADFSSTLAPEDVSVASIGTDLRWGRAAAAALKVSVLSFKYPPEVVRFLFSLPTPSFANIYHSRAFLPSTLQFRGFIFFTAS